MEDFAISQRLCFAIAPLLQHIQSHSDRPTIAEAEAIAAILIQSLMPNLTGDFLSTHLNAIRYHPLNTITPLTKLHLSSPKKDLPSHFPDIAPPRFECGDRLRWTSHHPNIDWGIVIGRFYTFAPHHCHWHWAYLIWLDPNSSSFPWLNADIAWEDDLEPLELESRP